MSNAIVSSSSCFLAGRPGGSERRRGRPLGEVGRAAGRRGATAACERHRCISSQSLREGQARAPVVRATSPGSAAADDGVELLRHKDGATTFKFGGEAKDPTEGLPAEVHALAGDVGALLKGVSVSVVGDNGKLNAAIARVLAPLLGYSLLINSEVFEQSTGQKVEAVAEEEGWNAVGAVEAVIMEQLAFNVRTVISTLGGGGGAAARGDCWRHFFGHMCIWAEEVMERGATEVVEAKPQNDAYSQAEIQVKLKRGQAPKEMAREAVPQILAAMHSLLQREDESPGLDLAGKKLLYMKFGARGDWPDMMPPEWRPEA